MSDPATDSDIAIVGIIGAGVMGAGFAQVALEADREVVLYDVDAVALVRARGKIDGDGGAAKLLGLHANTLRSRMHKLGVRWERFRMP